MNDWLEASGWAFPETLDMVMLVSRLVSAALFGAAIGWERQLHGRPSLLEMPKASESGNGAERDAREQARAIKASAEKREREQGRGRERAPR